MKNHTLFPSRKREAIVIASLFAFVVLLFIICLFVGPSGMTPGESVAALFGKGDATAVRIVRSVRLPRALAAIIAGAGLSMSGLVMQGCLDNPMASPSTLGVSNAAAFGANLSIIVFAGGFLVTGNNAANFFTFTDPFAVSAFAFVFAALAVLVVLGLSRLRAFRADVVVLAGIAIGSVFTAAVTVLQFYATDVGLSAAVIWTFGDLGRATFRTDAVMAAVVLAAGILFAFFSMKYNALLGGDEAAASMGVNVGRLRFVSLLAASLVTAVCVSFLGVIGFVGVICPHIAKKLLGQDHRFSLPASALSGSFLLLASDALSRAAGGGSALPVGAVTSLLGAPFFLFLILGKRGGDRRA